MDEESKSLIRRFYGSDLFDPVLPSDVKFRHFRFRTVDGKWVKVKRRIRTKEDLVHNILKLKAADVYYGTSLWLNPDRVSTKVGRGSLVDCVLLSNDLVFDVDCDEPLCLETLEIARQRTYNVYLGMKKYTDMQFEYCAFTGSKGFRLSYKDTKQKNQPNPHERITLITHNRKVFIKELLQNIEELKKNKKAYNTTTKIDEDITTNPLCVIRVLGTIHSKTGYQTTKIPITLLKTKITNILKKTPCIFTKRPGIPNKREMTDGTAEQTAPRPRPLFVGEDVAGLASLPFSNRFVSNRVVGTRCLVPILVYHKSRPFMREVSRLQAEFGLGELYVLQFKDEYYVLSLKLFQKRQLVKMLNRTSSRTKNSMSKFGEVFMPYNVSSLYVVDGVVNGQISRGHREFLNVRFGLSIEEGLFESSESSIKISDGVDLDGCA